MQRSHDIRHILLGIGSRLGKIIAVPNQAGIQAKLNGRFGLLRVVDDQELIGSVLCSQFHAVRRQRILHEQMRGIRVCGALEDGDRADLAGSAVRRNYQGNVFISVVNNLSDAVMQEADADDALTGADILARAGTGLGVNLNVLVKVRE